MTALWWYWLALQALFGLILWMIPKEPSRQLASTLAVMFMVIPNGFLLLLLWMVRQ